MKRFAFYGRVSTEDQQDPASSRNWQLARSRQVIEAAGGEIVAEFFDIGQSRSLPWKRRPEASRLLDAFRDAERGFDAVVIGEPQRAFYGNQFGLTFPVFVHYGVELWVPEVGGAVDPGSDAHDLVMSLYGGMSKGERNRIKIRVRSAMAAQAAVEGRFLGGRPPYGYVLADAGPHPNPAKAAIGQRLHRLEPDPVAAPDRRSGSSTSTSPAAGFYAIAEGLTRDGIPSPSAHDPGRNRHRQPAAAHGRRSRSGPSCTTRATPAARSGTSNAATRCCSTSTTSRSVTSRRCAGTTAAQWVWSERPTHAAIVDAETFEAAQDIFAGAQRIRSAQGDGRATPTCSRGSCRAGSAAARCRRRGTTARAYYRCKFPAEYAHRRGAARQDRLRPRGRDRARASTSGSAACSPKSTSTPHAKRSRR